MFSAMCARLPDDSACWIKPIVRKSAPSATMNCVGRHAQNPLLAETLSDNGVRVFAGVDELLTQSRGICASIAPLIEETHPDAHLVNAMKMGAPIVTTLKGSSRLRLSPPSGTLVAQNPLDMADKLLALAQNDQAWQHAKDAAADTEQVFEMMEVGFRIRKSIDQWCMPANVQPIPQQTVGHQLSI